MTGWGLTATYLIEEQQPELLVQSRALGWPWSQAPRNGQRPRRPRPELRQVLLRARTRRSHQHDKCECALTVFKLLSQG